MEVLSCRWTWLLVHSVQEKKKILWGNYKHWSYHRVQGSDGELNSSKIWGHLDLNSISSPLKSCTLPLTPQFYWIYITTFAYLKFLSAGEAFNFICQSPGFNLHPSWWPGLFELGGFCLCFVCVCLFNLHPSALCSPPRVHCDSQKVDVPDKGIFALEHVSLCWGMSSGTEQLQHGQQALHLECFVEQMWFSGFFVCLFVWMRLSVFNRGGGKESWDTAFTLYLNSLKSEVVWGIAGGEEYKIKY